MDLRSQRLQRKVPLESARVGGSVNRESFLVSARVGDPVNRESFLSARVGSLT